MICIYKNVDNSTRATSVNHLHEEVILYLDSSYLHHTIHSQSYIYEEFELVEISSFETRVMTN